MMIIDHIDLLSVEQYQKHKEQIPQTHQFWWLSSPGIKKLYACDVMPGGNVDYSVPIKTVGGVRPVLYIAGLDTDIGEEIEIFNRKWTVLNEHLVLCNSLIADYIFDSRDNNWNSSELKGYLNMWLLQKIEETEVCIAIKNKTEFLLLQKLCMTNNFNMLDYALFENIAKWGFDNTRIKFSPYKEWSITFMFDKDYSFVEFCDYINNNF